MRSILGPLPPLLLPPKCSYLTSSCPTHLFGSGCLSQPLLLPLTKPSSQARSLTCYLAHYLITSVILSSAESFFCYLAHSLAISLFYSLSCSLSHYLTHYLFILVILSPAESFYCYLAHSLAISLFYSLSRSLSHYLAHYNIISVILSLACKAHAYSWTNGKMGNEFPHSQAVFFVWMIAILERKWIICHSSFLEEKTSNKGK